MWFLKQLFNRVPKWAFLLVLLVVVVNTIYLINMSNLVVEDTGFAIENENCIITSVKHDSAAEKAGLKTGDIVLSINSVKITSLLLKINMFSNSRLVKIFSNLL